MSDIQQQIADGARPLARVGDVIAHGEAIPANVVRFVDSDGRPWTRSLIGHWHTSDDAVDACAVDECFEDGAWKMLSRYMPLTVVEVDPEPQPAEPVELHRYEPAPGMVCAVCGRDVMDDIHPDVRREHRCPNGDPHGPHTHRGFAAPDGTPPLWCPGGVAAPTSDPGTFAECVAWLIAVGLGSNADRRIDRMASQHQELQARYDTVVSDRATVKASLELVKQRIREAKQEPAESGPVVLSLPQVPDGAVALRGNSTGWRWVPYGDGGWENGQPVDGSWGEGTLVEVLMIEHPDGVTVEFAPPREPRTWEQLDTPDDVRCVDVCDVPLATPSRWTRRSTAFFYPDADSNGAGRTLAQLREVGEVREVLT